MKLGKQLEHVVKEKQRYQEGRVNTVLQQTMQGLKHLPMAKIQLTKSLKPLKDDLIEYLHDHYSGAQSFEHIGTVRSKPYLKLSTHRLRYQV
jgi:hypothetical protein